MPESCALCGASFGSVADLVEHTKTAHPSDVKSGATAPAAPTPVEQTANEPTPPGAEPPPPAPDPEFAAVDAAGAPESKPKLTCQFCGASFDTGEALASHNRSNHLAPPEGVTAE